MNYKHMDCLERVCILTLMCSSALAAVSNKKGGDSVNAGTELLRLTLEHNIGREGTFVERGMVQFKALKSNTGSFVQQKPLTHDEILVLKSMAELGKMYRLRTRATISSLSDEDTSDFISTTVRACLVVQSGLTETLTIHKDEAGNVFGLSLSIPGRSCEVVRVSGKGLPSVFNTTVVVSHGMQGPTPDTLSFVRKIEQEKKQKEQGTDNRSFLQKYWMYIVPGLVFYMIMQNVADPARQGGE